MTFMKQILIFFLLGVLLPIHTLPAQEAFSLRLGYVPLLSQLPLIMSYEDHRLKRQYVELSLTKHTSFTSLEAALRVGAIDAASIPVPMALRVAADAYQCEHCQIAIIGAIHRGGSVLVAREPGEFEALRGKMLGVPGLNSSEFLSLQHVLTTAGLRFGLDYKVLEVPFALSIQQLKSGKLDALYLPEPYGSLAEQEQIASPLHATVTTGLHDLLTVLVIRSELFVSHPLAVQEWLQSVIESCEAIETDINKSHGKQTAILQTPYFGYSQELVAASLVQRMGNLSFKYTFPSQEELQTILQWASDMKLVMRSLDWSALLNYELVKSVKDQ
jgi:ABC-type nitrate/sulfonate/bicarbonate transport system substrate-binding protein